MPTNSHTSSTSYSNCRMYSRQHEPKEPHNNMPLRKACKCGKLHIVKAKATV